MTNEVMKSFLYVDTSSRLEVPTAKMYSASVKFLDPDLCHESLNSQSHVIRATLAGSTAEAQATSLESLESYWFSASLTSVGGHLYISK